MNFQLILIYIHQMVALTLCMFITFKYTHSVYMKKTKTFFVISSINSGDFDNIWLIVS